MKRWKRGLIVGIFAVFCFLLAKTYSSNLNWLKSYSIKNKKYVKLNWESVSGDVYYVYKKLAGSGLYKKIAEKRATAGECSYTDVLKGKGEYTYTVRRKSGAEDGAAKDEKYDEEGITTLRDKPKVKVDFTNLHAVIHWEPVSGADGYEVYRKWKLNGKYHRIANIWGEGENSYVDVFHNSIRKEIREKYMIAGYFIDPSTQGYVYTVRAYKVEGGKKSYSDYYRDGDFYMDTPTVVDASRDTKNKEKVMIEWSTIRNAKEYYIYGGRVGEDEKVQWENIASVKAETSVRQKTLAEAGEEYTFFSVRAVSEKDGEQVFSDFDKGFYVDGRKYGNMNILYLGDSITFGSPYKSKETVEIFSYPWRISRLTGAKFYNPSIPGSTYSYKERDQDNYHRYRIVKDVAERIRDGKTPMQALHSNKQTYKDFDVVVLAAGTNDYLDDTVLGSVDSEDIHEFNGALNTIMGWIKEGSVQRIKEGKKAIKVIFVDLFYSDRTYHFAELTDRRKQKNHINLTLTDYQKDLERIMDKYKKQGVDIYRFETDEIVTGKNCPTASCDNLHMTRYTYSQIGNRLAEFMIKNKILAENK